MAPKSVTFLNILYYCHYVAHLSVYCIACRPIDAHYSQEIHILFSVV